MNNVFLEVNKEKIDSLQGDNLLALLVDKNLETQQFNNFLFVGFGDYATIVRPQISAEQLLYAINILVNIKNDMYQNMSEEEVNLIEERYNSFIDSQKED